MKNFLYLILLFNTFYLCGKSYQAPDGSIQHDKKRLLKKIEYCKKEVCRHENVTSFDDVTDKKGNKFKKIKRHYPKKIDFVKSQNDTWPDAYGYNPISGMHKKS